MNALTRRVLLRCPHDAAASALRRTCVPPRPAEGEPLQLRLKAPVRLRGLDAEIMLRDNVVVDFEKAEAAAAADPVIVRWRPAGGDAFPAFIGRLWTESDTESTSWLRLEGTYDGLPETLRIAEPGELAIGYRIAVATAKMLLDEVARSIEAQQGDGVLRQP